MNQTLERQSHDGNASGGNGSDKRVALSRQTIGGSTARRCTVIVTNGCARLSAVRKKPRSATHYVVLQNTIYPVVDELREQLGWYCAHLSTSMKFDTDVDQNILNSFFEGAKAGAHWGRHNRKIQYGRQPILDLVIIS